MFSIASEAGRSAEPGEMEVRHRAEQNHKTTRKETGKASCFTPSSSLCWRSWRRWSHGEGECAGMAGKKKKKRELHCWLFIEKEGHSASKRSRKDLLYRHREMRHISFLFDIRIAT